MHRLLSVMVSIALVFSVAVSACADEEDYDDYEDYENDIDIYDTDPSEWTDIVQIVNSYYMLLGLRADGTVLFHYIPGPWTNRDISSLICKEVVEWTDIQNLIEGNMCVVGLKNDGTVVSVAWDWREDDMVSFPIAGMERWNDITKIVPGLGWLAGLRGDGTVIVTEKYAAEDYDYGWGDEWLDVSAWENIADIIPYNGWSATNGLIGLKSDGTLLFTHPSKYNREGELFAEYIYEWDDIVSVCTTNSDFYGVRSDGTVAAPEGFDPAHLNNGGALVQGIRCWGTSPSGWTGVKALFSCYMDDIFALHKDGTVSAWIYNYFYLEKDLYQIQDWKNIKILYPYVSYIIGVTEDGSVQCISDEYEMGNLHDITAWNNIEDIVVGGDYTAGLTKDGTVRVIYFEN